MLYSPDVLYTYVLCPKAHASYPSSAIVIPRQAMPNSRSDTMPVVVQGHDEIVWAVEVSGARLFSASADKTIRVWDIESRRCEQVRTAFQTVQNLQSGTHDYPMPIARQVGTRLGVLCQLSHRC